MAKLRQKELEPLSADELSKRIVEIRRDLMKDNSQVAAGTIPKNPGQLRNNKKNVARLLNALSKKKEVIKKDE